MSDSHGLNKENMLAVLPGVLRNDEHMNALAEAISDALEKCAQGTDKLLIYPNIDNLPEELLDILAYDFKVDWWDYNYTLQEKLQTLEDSWMVHRKLGTRWAVKTAIAAIYPEVQISEWFEYNGKPYHFRMSIDDGNRQITPERHIRLLQLTKYYKNMRSHLDTIEYHSVHDPVESEVFVGGAAARFSRRTFCEIHPDRHAFCDLYIGGGATGRMSRVIHRKEPARSFTTLVYPAAGQGHKSSRVTINALKEGL